MGVLPIETESQELGAGEICPEATGTSGVVDPLLVFSPSTQIRRSYRVGYDIITYVRVDMIQT